MALQQAAGVLVSDIVLLDEIDEIFRKRLAEAAQSGLTTQALQRLANKYNRMYSLVDTRLARSPGHAVSDAFKDETYDFVVEGFFERIQKVYEPSHQADQTQVNRLIRQTRGKLQRIQLALFGMPAASDGL